MKNGYNYRQAFNHGDSYFRRCPLKFRRAMSNRDFDLTLYDYSSDNNTDNREHTMK